MVNNYSGFSSVESQQRWEVGLPPQGQEATEGVAAAVLQNRDQLSQAPAQGDGLTSLHQLERKVYLQQSDSPKLSEPLLKAPISEVVQEGLQAYHDGQKMFHGMDQLQTITAMQVVGRGSFEQRAGTTALNTEMLTERLGGGAALEKMAQELGMTVEQLVNTFFFASSFPEAVDGASAGKLLLEVAKNGYHPGAEENYTVASMQQQLFTSPPEKLVGPLKELAAELGLTVEQLEQVLIGAIGEQEPGLPPTLAKMFAEIETLAREQIRRDLFSSKFEEELPRSSAQVAQQLKISPEQAKQLLIQGKTALFQDKPIESLPVAAIRPVVDQLLNIFAKLDGPLVLREGKELPRFLEGGDPWVDSHITFTANQLHMSKEEVKQKLIELQANPQLPVPPQLRSLLKDLAPQLARQVREQNTEQSSDEAYPFVLIGHSAHVLEVHEKSQIPVEQIIKEISLWRSGELPEKQLHPEVARLALDVEASSRIMGQDRNAGVAAESSLRASFDAKYEDNFIDAMQQLGVEAEAQKLLFARHYPQYASVETKKVLKQVEMATGEVNQQQGIPKSFKPLLEEGSRSYIATSYDKLYEAKSEELFDSGQISQEQLMAIRSLHYFPEQLQTPDKARFPAPLVRLHQGIEKEVVAQVQQRFGASPMWKPEADKTGYWTLASAQVSEELLRQGLPATVLPPVVATKGTELLAQQRVAKAPPAEESLKGGVQEQQATGQLAALSQPALPASTIADKTDDWTLASAQVSEELLRQGLPDTVLPPVVATKGTELLAQQGVARALPAEETLNRGVQEQQATGQLAALSQQALPVSPVAERRSEAQVAQRATATGSEETADKAIEGVAEPKVSASGEETSHVSEKGVLQERSAPIGEEKSHVSEKGVPQERSAPKGEGKPLEGALAEKPQLQEQTRVEAEEEGKVELRREEKVQTGIAAKVQVEQEGKVEEGGKAKAVSQSQQAEELDKSKQAADSGQIAIAMEQIREAIQLPKELSPLAISGDKSLVGPAMQKFAAQGLRQMDEMVEIHQQTSNLMAQDDVNRVLYTKFLSITREALQGYREMLFAVASSDARMAKQLAIAQFDKRMGQLERMKEILEERKEAIEEARAKAEQLDIVLTVLLFLGTIGFLTFMFTSLLLAMVHGDPAYMLLASDLVFKTENTTTLQRAEMLQILVMIISIVITIILFIIMAAVTLLTFGAALPVVIFLSILLTLTLASIIASIVQIGYTLDGNEDAAMIAGYVALALDALTIIISIIAAGAQAMAQAVSSMVKAIAAMMAKILAEITKQAAEAGTKVTVKIVVKVIMQVLIDVIEETAKKVGSAISKAADELVEIIKNAYKSATSGSKGGAAAGKGGEASSAGSSSSSQASKSADAADSVDDAKGAKGGWKSARPSSAARSTSSSSEFTQAGTKAESGVSKSAEGLKQTAGQQKKQLVERMKQMFSESGDYFRSAGSKKGAQGAKSEGSAIGQQREAAQAAKIAKANKQAEPFRRAFAYTEAGTNVFQSLLQAYMTIREAQLAKIQAEMRALTIEANTFNRYVDSVVANLRQHADQLMQEIGDVTKQLAVIGSDMDRFWKQLSDMSSSISGALS